MAKHALLRAKKGYDLSILPEPFSKMKPRTEDTSFFSKENHEKGLSYAPLHSYIAKAVLEMAKGKNSSITCVSVAKNCFVTEQVLDSGKTLVFRIGANGECSASEFNATMRAEPLPPIGSEKDDYDMSAIFLGLLMYAANNSGELTKIINDLTSMADAYQFLESNPDMLYLVCDSLMGALNTKAVNPKIPGGNFNMITPVTLSSGALNGTVLCGKPTLINNVGGSSSKSSEGMTFGEVKEEFKEWAESKVWTSAEEMLIPRFPDDYIVPPEAIKIARRFVATHEDKRPMLNFMWRGITSYGKSTGVEMIASLLHTPLLRMTCHSSMETQDFLANIIPVSKPSVDVKLPSHELIGLDPETAYTMMTGIKKVGVTPDECMTAYGEVYAAMKNNGSGSLFKQVESNYVKALQHGYIVEIQEVSRIRDPGVLVGINEYDRAGAIVPLVDGSIIRRHPDAMVIFTDNVGYASCRPIDPSSLRRMAIVIDSNEMPKKMVIDRVIYNTGFQDAGLLETMYNVWDKVRVHCADRDITDGSISLTELEMWAQSVVADGYGNIEENCIDCVVSKATSDPSEQAEIISDVINVHLNLN